MSCVAHAEPVFISEETRHTTRERFVTLLIPHCVVKKGPRHGARHGNTERQQISHAAHIAAEWVKKKGFFNPSWTFSSISDLQRVTARVWMGEVFCAHSDKTFK